jgi:hypothetical protein
MIAFHVKLRRKSPIAAVFVLVQLSTATVPGQAAVVRGTFEGTVTATTGAKSGLTSLNSLGVTAGAIVQGVFQYDATQPADTLPSDTQNGQFSFVPAAPVNYVELTIGGDTWLSSSRLDAYVLNDGDVGSPPFLDRLNFAALDPFSLFPGSLGLSGDSINLSWQQQNSAPTFLVSDGLPDQPGTFPTTVVGSGSLMSIDAGPAPPDGQPSFWQISFSIGETTLCQIPEPVSGIVWVILGASLFVGTGRGHPRCK